MGDVGLVGLIIFFILLAGALVYTIVVWFQVVARSKRVSNEALQGQAKALAMEERSLAAAEELLTLHRETNALLRQLVERAEQSGRG